MGGDHGRKFTVRDAPWRRAQLVNWGQTRFNCPLASELLVPIVRDAGEEPLHVERERISAAFGPPGELVVDEPRLFVSRSPNLERFGAAVDHPVFRHAVFLKEVSLRDAVVADGTRR